MQVLGRVIGTSRTRQKQTKCTANKVKGCGLFSAVIYGLLSTCSSAGKTAGSEKSGTWD